MSLQGVPFRGLPLNAQVAPTSGHPCLMQGNRCDSRPTHALRNSFVLDSYLVVRNWHCACILKLQRGGRHLVAETDSAANQFGAPESVEDPRGTFPLFVARACPSRICRISGKESDYEHL